MTDTTDPQTDPAERLESIRRALAAVAADRPTPEQIAGWNTADRGMAQRIRAALPGVPLHHAYAVLQALRVTQRLDAAAAQPPTDRSGLRERITEAIDRVTGGTCPGDIIDAVLSVLPPDADRAASYRHAADAIESMQGYPHLILPEEIVAALRLLATGEQPDPGSPAYIRRLAAGERDEQQAQQDRPETREWHRTSGFDQHDDYRTDVPAAAPVAGQPPADTGEEARAVCVCSHTRAEHVVVSGRLLCDECDPDSTENLVCKEFEAL